MKDMHVNQEDVMDSDTTQSSKSQSSGRPGEAPDILAPALWGTGLVFAAVDAEPFAGRSTFQPRRARIRRLESLRPATVTGGSGTV
jgi:hypothetical protein